MNISVPTTLNTSNLTLDIPQYLALNLGERYVTTPQLIVLNIIYIGIFLSGTIGNICTCIVIARNRHMHTATNYYLMSLAISDLMTLFIAWPSELYSIWESYPFRFGPIFCIIKSYVQEGTAYASVLTITAFTVERYAAICHPMRFKSFSSLSRSVKIILAMWITAFCVALPYAIYAKIYYYLWHPYTNEPLEDSLVCNVPFEHQHTMIFMFQISAFAFFLLPMLIIVIMYIMIGSTLYRSDFIGDGKSLSKNSVIVRTVGKRNTSSMYDPTKARKSVLKMLVAVVIAFFLCWAPFHAQRLMTLYIPPEAWTPRLHTIQNILFYVSGVLYFVSATVNPILYNLMSKKFRQASKRTLCKCLLKKEYKSKSNLFGTLASKDRHSKFFSSNVLRHGTSTSLPETLEGFSM